MSILSLLISPLQTEVPLLDMAMALMVLMVAVVFFILVRVRFPWMWAIGMHGRLVFLRLPNGSIVIKPFKNTPRGISYKIGKTSHEKLIEREEIASFYGKSVVEIGLPSGLPLNVELAMGNPEDLEKLISGKVDEAYPEYEKKMTELNLKANKEWKIDANYQTFLRSKLKEQVIDQFSGSLIYVKRWFHYLTTYANETVEELARQYNELAAIQLLKKDTERLITLGIVALLLMVGLGIMAKFLNVV